MPTTQMDRSLFRLARSTLLAAIVGSLALGPAACSDGSAKRSSRKATTRQANSTAKANEPDVITPQDAMSQATPAKIVPMTSMERAALREKALALLIATAQTGTPEERANAIEALVQTPARLAPVAEAGLQDQNAGVRSVAAMAVGRAKLTALAPRLRPLLQDESMFVRLGAYYGLKRCGSTVDLSPLAGMLFDESPRVRAQAAFVLGEIGDKSALPMLRDAHPQVAQRANPAEVKLSDLQVAEARVKLGDDSALADIRAALFPAKPEDLEAAVLAIQLVGELKDTASINRLIDLTSPKEPGGQELPGEIRMAAASSLAKMGQPQGSYIAREYFQGGKETLRAQAAYLFGETQRPENLQIVSRLMTDPDGRVRVAASSAVVRITDKGS